MKAPPLAPTTTFSFPFYMEIVRNHCKRTMSTLTNNNETFQNHIDDNVEKDSQI